ncbi:uncharacterized protein PG986_008805 [Apiospora aurea]|uniref:Uncharacterized protein n=1 Tax=Apiospora aurea TaxID=335848 RepID=A0ABR1Q5X1_9PEZI
MPFQTAYAILEFIADYSLLHPFVRSHVIDPYFVPIAPAWAQVGTFVFQLVGRETATPYRVFPPARVLPSRLRPAGQPRRQPLLPGVYAHHRLLRPLYVRSLGMWIVLLVLRAWFERAIIVAALAQSMHDGQKGPVLWKSALLTILT